MKNLKMYRSFSLILIITFLCMFLLVFFQDTTIFNRYRNISTIDEQQLYLFQTNSSKDLYEQKNYNNFYSTLVENEVLNHEYHTMSIMSLDYTNELKQGLVFDLVFTDGKLFSSQYIERRGNNVSLGISVEEVKMKKGKVWSSEIIGGIANGVILSERSSLLLFGRKNSIGEIVRVPMGEEKIIELMVQGIVSNSNFENSLRKEIGQEVVSLVVYLSNIHLSSLQDSSYLLNVSIFDVEKPKYYATLKTNAGIDYLSGYRIQNLYKIERISRITSAMILISIVTLISTLNLYASLKSIMIQRMEEIGIMRSVGASNKQIVLLFFIESSILMLLSIIVAMVLSLFLMSCFVLSQRKFNYYYVFYIYRSSIIMLGGLVLLQTIICSVIASFQAIQIKIVDALRKNY